MKIWLEWSPLPPVQEPLPSHKKIKECTVEGAFPWNKERSSTRAHGGARYTVTHKMLVLVKKSG